jgi:hypothetical protein
MKCELSVDVKFHVRATTRKSKLRTILLFNNICLPFSNEIGRSLSSHSVCVAVIMLGKVSI